MKYLDDLKIVIDINSYTMSFIGGNMTMAGSTSIKSSNTNGLVLDFGSGVGDDYISNNS